MAREQFGSTLISSRPAGRIPLIPYWEDPMVASDAAAILELMKIRALVSASVFLLVAASAVAQPSSVETITKLITAHRGEANPHPTDRLRS